ncbi:MULTISPECIES: branched-chain amino acid aminotransferase [Bacillaceae]|uniref:Branched-chain-amino-acid aminotransferase n=1 Tax=Evansella alkalicola TaxID=745819 RepID=A0ABS6JSS9_9BACI|nr:MULTISPECIES: branched-chain amino acid aminotransferase [Bacillaceae]MBU9721480.1 branched-chain amino acid aminotransferase [Bacillus alkalicola]
MNKDNITIVKTTNGKAKPSENALGFGKYFTDHMFVLDYDIDNGWHSPRVVPYEPITLDPAAMVFHYGQTVFEGLKAYYGTNGKTMLFRPEKNVERLNRSCNRLSIPEIDEELFLKGLKTLIAVEKEWIPKEDGTSLYIRPFILPTETNLRVAPANSYKFIIILSPVGAYYAEGIHPVAINVEKEYTRAVLGGTGTAKTAGNYCAGYKAQKKASEQGAAQVLWLDGVEKKYIEEVGSMNIFFKINGEVVTPELNGSILEGITRMSIIELLKKWGIPVTEKKISFEEFVQAYEDGIVEEVFGTGTAAVISPVGEFRFQDKIMIINNRETGELSKKLYDTITGIQTGKMEDELNWTIEV